MHKPLNILLLNHDWFARELRQLGHSVVVAKHTDFGTAKEPHPYGISLAEITARVSPAAPIERIVFLDESHFPWVSDIHTSSVPTVFYSIDTHHHWRWHCRFASLFDETLVAQKDSIPKFQERGVAARWFPEWATATAPFEGTRDIDVSFRGTLDPVLHPERAEFFAALRQEVEVDAQTGDVEEAYGRSRIVVNQTISDDLNFRVFEAMGCGALLVTPHNGNGLLDLFRPGSEIVTYKRGDASDSAAKIRYYLEHEEERSDIAGRGYDLVMRHHTAAARAIELDAILQNARVTARAGAHAAAAAVFLLSYEVARERKGLGREKFLSLTAEELCRSAEKKETSGEFEWTVLRTSFYLEDESRKDRAFEIVERASRSRPSDELLCLRYVQMLLEKRNLEAARAVAALIAPHPDLFAQQAAGLVEELRRSVLHTA